MLKHYIIFVLLLLSLNTQADQLIIEPDMGRQPIINMMNQANHSIHLVTYGFTDKILLDAIIRKKSQGKNIKIILEKTPYKSEKENNKTIQQLNINHIAWQGRIPGFKLIHQKTFITDNQKAMIMTFNFTKSAFKNQRNFALIIDDAARVNAINHIFSADWKHVAYVNTNDDLILSPDNSRNKLIALIQQSKKNIKIYAQNINDYQIVEALAKAARKGSSIQIITSARMNEKQYQYLTRANVSIHFSHQYYIHAKAFIIDGNKAIIGSINLTTPSLNDNRELAVVTIDQQVIKQLTDIFNRDWKNQHVLH